jgi:hypothetical protein
MKRVLTTILFSSFYFMVFAQSFEGEIVYHNSYKSKMPSMKDEQFADLLGTVQQYYIRGGDYKSVTNGSFVKWQLYINKENKLYTSVANSEALLWNDAGLNTDSVLKVELHPSVLEILGYKCDELVLTCKTGLQKYYFTHKLPVNSKLYTNHKYGNWSVYLSAANAVPLKTIIENAQLTLESVATEIKSLNLDQVFFALPPGTKSAKSPY